MALVECPTIPGLQVQEFSVNPAMHLLGMALWDATVNNTTTRHAPNGVAWTLHAVLTREERDTIHFPPMDPKVYWQRQQQAQWL